MLESETKELKGFIESLDAYIDGIEERRKMLYKQIQSIRCPKCGSEQIQLVNITSPALCRCRKLGCKHSFLLKEPEPCLQDQS